MADFAPVNLNLFKQRDYVTRPSEGTSPQNEEIFIWDSPIKGKSPLLESIDDQTKLALVWKPGPALTPAEDPNAIKEAIKNLKNKEADKPEVKPEIKVHKQNYDSSKLAKQINLGFEGEIKKFDFSPDNIVPDINPETSKATESTESSDFPVNRTTIAPVTLKQKSPDKIAKADSAAGLGKAVSYQRQETEADDNHTFLNRTQRHHKAKKPHTDHKSGEAHNNRQASAAPDKATEARKAAEAKKVAEARKAVEAKKAEAARKAAEYERLKKQWIEKEYEPLTGAQARAAALPAVSPKSPGAVPVRIGSVWDGKGNLKTNPEYKYVNKKDAIKAGLY